MASFGAQTRQQAVADRILMKPQHFIDIAHAALFFLIQGFELQRKTGKRDVKKKRGGGEFSWQVADLRKRDTNHGQRPSVKCVLICQRF